jgi:hypothetical protein
VHCARLHAVVAQGALERGEAGPAPAPAVPPERVGREGFGEKREAAGSD